jgi:hypothetical protein
MSGNGFKNKKYLFLFPFIEAFSDKAYLYSGYISWGFVFLPASVLWVLFYKAVYDYFCSLGFASFGAAFITAYLATVSFMAITVLSYDLDNVIYVRLRARRGDVVRFMDGAYVVYARDQHHAENAYTNIKDAIKDFVRSTPRTYKALVRPVIVIPWRVRDDTALLRRVLDHEFEHAKSSLIKTLIFVSALSFSLGMSTGIPLSIFSNSIPVFNNFTFNFTFAIILAFIAITSLLLIDYVARIPEELRVVSRLIKRGDEDSYRELRNLVSGMSMYLSRLSSGDILNKLLKYYFVAFLPFEGLGGVPSGSAKVDSYVNDLVRDWTSHTPVVVFMLPWLLPSSSISTIMVSVLLKPVSPYFPIITYLVLLASSTLVSYLLALIIRPFVSRYVGVDPLRASAWVSSSFVAVASILYPLVVFVNPLFTFAIALATLVTSIITSWTFTEDWGKAVEVGVIAWLIMIAVVALVGYIAMVKVGLWRLLWGSI